MEFAIACVTVKGHRDIVFFADSDESVDVLGQPGILNGDVLDERYGVAIALFSVQ